MFHPLLDLSPEVQSALEKRQPVVALESTIIAHGMPYPQNVETALKVEQIIREAGAVPATIGVKAGRLCAGLQKSAIDELGRLAGQVVKLSRRDLSVALSEQLTGATTVATTMIIAHLAGIKVFATGGIGGVHRGGAQHFDISADLQELANTPVAVVCAGAKSILDIGLTLEYLETYGVPVIGYRCSQFPAFYARESGFEVAHRLDSTSDIARTMHIQWQLGLKSGLLVANPVPEAFAMDKRDMDAAIDQAIVEADSRQITGKALTPFLLARIKELTAGVSLAANIQLVYHNALVAAQVAVAFSKNQHG